MLRVAFNFLNEADIYCKISLNCNVIFRKPPMNLMAFDRVEEIARENLDHALVLFAPNFPSLTGKTDVGPHLITECPRVSPLSDDQHLLNSCQDRSASPTALPSKSRLLIGTRSS